MDLGIGMVRWLVGACAKLLPKNKTCWVGKEGGRACAVERRMLSLLCHHSEKTNSLCK